MKKLTMSTIVTVYPLLLRGCLVDINWVAFMVDGSWVVFMVDGIWVAFMVDGSWEGDDVTFPISGVLDVDPLNKSGKF